MTKHQIEAWLLRKHIQGSVWSFKSVFEKECEILMFKYECNYVMELLGSLLHQISEFEKHQR